jgi:uncharacterized protein YndB with AHSA1/START domain
MAQPAPFVITRTLIAPRVLVFEVHTKPHHLAKWLSPQGFRCIHADMTFTAGGVYRYGLEGPNGMQMCGKQSFREIVPNEKLVYIQSFSDKDGGVTRHPMSATWPPEMLVTVTFEKLRPNQTLLTLTWSPYNSDVAGNAAFEQGRASMEMGFAGMFAKLDEYLSELQA